jgi:hypothetical protein
VRRREIAQRRICPRLDELELAPGSPCRLLERARRLLDGGRMANRHDRYAAAAAGALGLGVLVEAFRLLPGHTWPGYDEGLSRTVSAALIVLWSVTGAATLLRRRHRLFAGLTFTLAVLSPLFMVAHAAITRVGGALLGLVYVPLAALIGFLLKRTLDGGQWATLPTKDPGGRVAGAEKGYRLIPRPRG